MLTSLPSEEKLGKALLPVPFLVSFSTSTLPQSSDPTEPSASHREERPRLKEWLEALHLLRRLLLHSVHHVWPEIGLPASNFERLSRAIGKTHHCKHPAEHCANSDATLCREHKSDA